MQVAWSQKPRVHREHERGRRVPNAHQDRIHSEPMNRLSPRVPVRPILETQWRSRCEDSRLAIDSEDPSLQTAKIHRPQTAGAPRRLQEGPESIVYVPSCVAQSCRRCGPPYGRWHDEVALERTRFRLRHSGRKASSPTETCCRASPEGPGG